MLKSGENLARASGVRVASWPPPQQCPQQVPQRGPPDLSLSHPTDLPIYAGQVFL